MDYPYDLVGKLIFVVAQKVIANPIKIILHNLDEWSLSAIDSRMKMGFCPFLDLNIRLFSLNHERMEVGFVSQPYFLISYMKEICWNTILSLYPVAKKFQDRNYLCSIKPNKIIT